MILKSIDYIRNIKIFTNVNHGANGLLSIEGFIIVLISALILNETDQFADAMRSALQKRFHEFVGNIGNIFINLAWLNDFYLSHKCFRCTRQGSCYQYFLLEYNYNIP